MNKPVTARATFLCFLFTNIESIFYDCFRSVSTMTGSVLIVELCKSQALLMLHLKSGRNIHFVIISVLRDHAVLTA